MTAQPFVVIDNTKPKQRTAYFEEDFEPYLSGKWPLPNFEEMKPEEGISLLACAGGTVAVEGVRRAMLLHDRDPVSSSFGQWARYFLNTLQSGAFDGTGFVMLYGPTYGKGRIGRFALCKHQKVEASDARPQVGYHPGHCSKCGIDLTVDSGD